MATPDARLAEHVARIVAASTAEPKSGRELGEAAGLRREDAVNAVRAALDAGRLVAGWPERGHARYVRGFALPTDELDLVAQADALDARVRVDPMVLLEPRTLAWLAALDAPARATVDERLAVIASDEVRADVWAAVDARRGGTPC